MKNKKLHFEESMSFDIGPEDSIPELQPGQGRLRNKRLMSAALKVALRQELTGRQRECVEMYFMERMTMEEIGKKLGIGKSTVYKHLKTAKAHIRRVLAYAQAFQAVMDEEED